MKSLEQFPAVRTQWLELEGVTKALIRELDRVSHLALYPVQCKLCSGK